MSAQEGDIREFLCQDPKPKGRLQHGMLCSVNLNDPGFFVMHDLIEDFLHYRSMNLDTGKIMVEHQSAHAKFA